MADLLSGYVVAVSQNPIGTQVVGAVASGATAEPIT